MNKRGVTGFLPMQRAMLSLGASSEGLTPYVQQFRLSIRRLSDSQKYQNAWAQVFQQFDVFNLSLSQLENGQLSFVDNEIPNVPFTVVNYHEKDPAEAEMAIADYASNDYLKGIDILNEPLSRFQLFLLSDNRAELIWTSHHAIMDGRSRSIILKAVASIYRNQAGALSSGTPSFVEYLKWFSSENVSASEAYWREQLNAFEASPKIQWGLGFPGHEQVEALPQKVELYLDASLRKQLHLLAHDLGVTANTVYQGAWALMLQRVLRTNRVCFGAPRACRHSAFPGSEDLVGLLMNVVPVIVDFQEGDTIYAFLQRLRTAWTAARDHERYSFAELTDSHGVPRPVPYQSLLGCEYSDLNNPDWALEGEENISCELRAQTNMPLSIQFFDSKQCRLEITYNNQEYRHQAIESLAQCLVYVLEQLVDSKKRLLSEVSLTAEMPPISLNEPLPWREWLNIGARFTAIAQDYPKNVAIDTGTQTMTYEELDAMSNQLAHVMRDRYAVTEGNHVVVCHARGLMTPVLYLAVVRAGAAYVPADPKEPVERIQELVEDCDAALLLVDALTKLPLNGTAPIAAVSDLLKIEHTIKGDVLPAEPSHESPAYLVYTSGSTGKPKAVSIPHRGVLRLVIEPDYAALDATSRILHISATHFDATTFEIWGALLNGGTIVVYENQAMDLEQLEQLVDKGRVDTAFITTSLFNLMVKEAPKIFEPMRQILVGGEALSPECMLRTQRMFPDSRLINVYGPTENTTFSTFYPIPELSEKSKSIPIGIAISGSTAYVLDDCQRSLPLGVTGELYVGGDGVASEYWKRPELTQERFVTVDFEWGRERLYKTGDMVYKREDGLFEFIGRVDNQVKIRGFRIELEEVQAHVSRCKGVRQAVIKLFQNPEKTLVAYVIPVDVETFDVAQLRAELESAIPGYMVPALFSVHERLPLNRNGKVDMNQLVFPEASKSSETKFVEGSIEGRLFDIWSTILSSSYVTADTSFFALGGHSLTVIVLVEHIEREFAERISVSDADQHDTLNKQAALIRQSESASLPVANKTSTLKKELCEGGFRYPANALLKSRYQFANSNGECDLVITRGYHFKGSLNVDALKRAFACVVNTHEALKSCLKEYDGALWQVVVNRASPEWNDIDFTHLDEPEAEAQFYALFNAEGFRTMPFAPAPQMRLYLIALAQEHYGLIFTLSHVVCDGTSLAQFMDEVASVYNQIVAKQPIKIPKEVYTVREDYQVMKAKMDGAFGDELRAYWHRKMEGIEPFQLPIEQVDTLPGFAPGVSRHWRAEPAFNARIQSFCQAQSTTVTAVTLTGWLLTLAYYRNSNDLNALLITDARTALGGPPAFGDMVGRVFLREHVSNDDSLLGCLQQVREGMAHSLKYRSTRVEDFPEFILDKGLYHNDWGMGFSFVDEFLQQPAMQLSEVRTEPLLRRARNSVNKIHLTLRRTTDDYSLMITYAEVLFARDSISRMVYLFECVVNALIDNTDTSLGQLKASLPQSNLTSPLSPEEKSRSAFTEI